MCDFECVPFWFLELCVCVCWLGGQSQRECHLLRPRIQSLKLKLVLLAGTHDPRRHRCVASAMAMLILVRTRLNTTE